MTIITSKSSRVDVERFLRSLPEVLTGAAPDTFGIAEGMRSRVGFTLFSQIMESFEQKSRGQVGGDGIKWPPLSKKYLAYQRPVIGRKPPKAGKLAPGDKDGFLSETQLKQWRQIYTYNLKRLAGKYELTEAKGRSAAIAWNTMKRNGAKTKLEVFGNRKVGVDYHTLVDEGTLRRSLLPAEVLEGVGGAAEYQKSDENQLYEQQPDSVAVGTNVPYATHHHNPKNKKNQRALWPEEFPGSWWKEILDSILYGITQIGDLAEAGQL